MYRDVQTILAILLAVGLVGFLYLLPATTDLQVMVRSLRRMSVFFLFVPLLAAAMVAFPVYFAELARHGAGYRPAEVPPLVFRVLGWLCLTLCVLVAIWIPL